MSKRWLIVAAIAIEVLVLSWLPVIGVTIPLAALALIFTLEYLNINEIAFLGVLTGWLSDILLAQQRGVLLLSWLLFTICLIIYSQMQVPVKAPAKIGLIAIYSFFITSLSVVNLSGGDFNIWLYHLVASLAVGAGLIIIVERVNSALGKLL